MLAFDVKKSTETECLFRPARVEDAQELVSMYEGVFGKNGVRAEGHEPYPAPEVFSIEGILKVLEDQQRQFLVAELDGRIAGGLIVTHNSPFHREFGCVCVGKNFQGRGISSLMLSYQKQVEKKSSLVINTTEIVTHSLLSQCAHHRAGYDKITGLGYLQYPKVFFPTHPESCLWITSLEGLIFDLLRSSNPTACLSKPKEKFEDSRALNIEEKQLFRALQITRNIFAPDFYQPLIAKIIGQFKDTLNYRIFSDASPSNLNQSAHPGDLELDLCGDAPYAYITFPIDPLVDESLNLWKSLQKIRSANKRYVQARIPINSKAAIRHIDLLRERGFIFLGLAPLFQLSKDGNFADILIMQWIAPSVIESCGLPGETNCQAKLYGYPLSLIGDIAEVMRQDLSRGNGGKLFEDYPEF